jgi:hypothetical protein
MELSSAASLLGREYERIEGCLYPLAGLSWALAEYYNLQDYLQVYWKLE